MKMNKTVLSTAVGLALGLASLTTYAATVTNTEYLTITAGSSTSASSVVTITGGSFFGMDTNKDSKIQTAEADMISQGTTGLVFGITTAAGASHSGLPVAGDTNAIDAPWAFFGNTGSDYLKVAVSGGTSSGASAGGLNLSGWTVTWNGIPAINMGGGAWQPLNCSAVWMQCGGHTFTNSNAEFTWDGVSGDPYTLNYAATVPAGDPSGFGGVKYYLHLVGTVIIPSPLTCSNGGTCTVNPIGTTPSTEVTGASLPTGYTADTDPAFNSPSLYYDFTATAAASTPFETNVVIPLTTPLTTGTVYRIQNGSSTWVNFDTTPANGSILSASSSSGICPAPGNSAYTAGLNPGDSCVELVIVLGGTDDHGGTTGAVTELGAFETPVTATFTGTTVPSGSSGCSISPKPINPFKRSDWFLLLGFVTWLGFWRRKRHG